MKKIIFVLFLTLVLSGGFLFASANKSEPPEEYFLMKIFGYDRVKPENITSLQITRYTVGGADTKNIDDKTEIKEIYDYLSRIKVTNETGMRCEDNTTVFVFNLKDGSSVSLELECDWVVVKGKRFNIKMQ